MKIKTILTRITQSFIAALVAGSCLMAPNAIAGEGALLGITPAFPTITYTGTVGQGCSYDADFYGAGSGKLTITGTPGLTLFGALPTGPIGFVAGGLVTMELDIDSAGVLSGGTFAVTGSMTVPSAYSSPLLTGTFSGGDYGIVDILPGQPGTTDQMDARAIVTGGSLAPLYAGNDIGILVTQENSAVPLVAGYAGTMTEDWLCARAKGSIGQTPPPVVQGCNLSIVKTATTYHGDGTIGPLGTTWNGDPDTDSDSGRDHDNSGDSDDSDSDSEHDSADSDAGGPNCGCKGRVTALTLKSNNLQTVDVKVMNGKMNKTYFDASVAPGAEFSFTFKAKAIKVIVNGGEVASLKTKCKDPIGTGQVIGNFIVVDGSSKKSNLPLCPYPGTTCDPSLEVTYDYIVTSNGPASAYDIVVSDDQLGILGTIPVLGANMSQPFQETVCVFDTTTNIATADGFTATGGAGSPCEFVQGEPPTNTATVWLRPEPCAPGDSDSDSHSDHDNSGDTDDDSDSDSGPGDCDGDGT